MAPRRGGGGSDIDVGGGSSSSSSSCDLDYPCSITISFMYGHRYTSLYSKSDIYGQLIVYIIWSIALIFLLLKSMKTKAPWLQLAMTLFLAGFALLCVRYGLLVDGVDVPFGYRFESSVIVLLQRLGMVLLFAAVYHQLRPGKLSKILFYPALAIYAILNMAYLIMDFIISKEALNGYKDSGLWRLSDRDFGLTYTAHQIQELKTASTGSGLSPFHIEDRAFDFTADDYLHDRGIQIKIGVAADFLAAVLAVFIAVVSTVSWIRRKNSLKETVWLLLAGAGLVLSTLFRVVVVTHYVLWNWKVVTDIERWNDWIDTYPSVEGIQPINPPDGFLEGYRKTVDGFPVVQAVLEPLGIVLACAATVHVLLLRRATDRSMQDLTGTGKGQQ